MASLLGESLEATPTSAYQMAFDLASLGDEGLVTALLPLLPADPRVEPLRSVLLGTMSRQL